MAQELLLNLRYVPITDARETIIETQMAIVIARAGEMPTFTAAASTAWVTCCAWGEDTLSITSSTNWTAGGTESAALGAASWGDTVKETGSFGVAATDGCRELG